MPPIAAEHELLVDPSRAAPRVALLVGTPRSGTTLISSMLGGARGVLSLSEPYLTHAVMPDWKLHRFFWRFQRDAGLLRRPPPFCGDARAFGRFMALTAAENGFGCLAIKETFRSAPVHAAWDNIGLLGELASQASACAALIREPFDTAASTIKFCRPILGLLGRVARIRWPNTPLFRNADAVAEWSARNWATYVDWVQERGLPLMRYEDFVAEPAARLPELCAWLGIDFDPVMLTPQPRGRTFWGIGDPEVVRRPRKTVDRRAVGRGARLSARQRAAVRELCADRARQLGYEC
ncbi:MAG: sulfotransferase [Phycisphaerae bacterium]|jgi:hypothetical protein